MNLRVVNGAVGVADFDIAARECRAEFSGYSDDAAENVLTVLLRIHAAIAVERLGRERAGRLMRAVAADAGASVSPRAKSGIARFTEGYAWTFAGAGAAALVIAAFAGLR